MNCVSLKELYEAIIDEILDFAKEKGNQGLLDLQKNKKYSNLELAIYIIYNAKIDNSFKLYQNSLKTFLDNVKYQFDEIKIFPEISDDDCFLAYSLLCAVYCMFQEENEKILETFNIKRFPKILKVIEEYSDIEKLENVYSNKFYSFTKSNINNIDNNIKNWFKVLYEKELGSIPNIKRETKKNKKKKTKINMNNDVNNDIMQLNEDKNLNCDKKKDNNNVNNCHNEEDPKISDNSEGTLSEQSKSQNIETTPSEESKSQNDNISEIKHSEEMKIANDNKIEISHNEQKNSQNQIINPDVQNINKEDNMNNDNSEINNLSELNKQIDEKSNTIDNILKQLDEKKSTFTDNEKLMFTVLKEFQKNNIATNKELIEYRKNIDNINKELLESKANSENLLERVDRLEKHQVLLYNQMALYQNARDSGKSIFYYLYKYFGLNGKIKLFEKTKEVFNYLDAKNNDNSKLSEYEKIIMKKFLKIMYFINKCNNKILHNLFTSQTKSMIKDIQQRDKGFIVFPEFSYKQFMKSMKYFIENSKNNKEIQLALCDAYNTYLIDNGLESILDKNKECISKENDTIIFKIKNEEIDQAINVLNKIIIGDESLESLCDKTTWDQSK